MVGWVKGVQTVHCEFAKVSSGIKTGGEACRDRSIEGGV